MKEFRTSKILLFGIFFFFFFLDNSKKNKVGGIRSRAKSWVALGTATRHPSSSVLLTVKIMLVLIFMAGGRVVVHARRMGTVGMKSCGYSDPHVQKLHKLWHTSLLLREREREREKLCVAVECQKNWKRSECVLRRNIYLYLYHLPLSASSLFPSSL